MSGAEARRLRAGSARFRRAERLRDPRDYRRVTAGGRRAASRSFVVIAVRRPDDAGADGAQGARLGVTASRRVGGAVERNRVKRRIREWFRHSKAGLARDADIVVIARRPAVGLDAARAEAELTRLAAEATG